MHGNQDLVVRGNMSSLDKHPAPHLGVDHSADSLFKPAPEDRGVVLQPTAVGIYY